MKNKFEFIHVNNYKAKTLFRTNNIQLYRNNTINPWLKLSEIVKLKFCFCVILDQCSTYKCGSSLRIKSNKILFRNNEITVSKCFKVDIIVPSIPMKRLGL